MPPDPQPSRLSQLTPAEWEALCDGCAKCCVHKLEDEETGEIHYTRVACRLLDLETCRCMDYENRHERVPDCAVLTANCTELLRWMPDTCAYRRLHEGRPLPAWHPLVSGTPDTVRPHRACAHGGLIPEAFVDPDDYGDFVVEEENEAPA